ncbi:hypothetical protein D3C87_1585900 [compost metagenome]
MSLLGLRHLGQHRADLFARRLVERFEHLAALRGDAQLDRPRVVGRAALADQPLFLEAGNHSADVAGVQAQFLAKIRRSQPLTVRQFVQDADFRQRKLAVEQMLMQHADLAGIETVEAADSLGAFGQCPGHHLPNPSKYLPQAIIYWFDRWINESDLGTFANAPAAFRRQVLPGHPTKRAPRSPRPQQGKGPP